MKRVWALLLCVLMALSVSACREKQQEGIPLRPRTTATGTTEFTDSTEEPEISYAHNEQIDNFFKRYVDLEGTRLDTNTIRRGKDKTEYSAELNQCSVTFADLSHKTFSSGVPYVLQISIFGGTTEKSKERMMETFVDVIQAADPGCSKESAQAAADHVAAMTAWKGAINISERVILQYYTVSLVEDQYRMDVRVIDPALATTTDTSVTAPTTVQ